MVAGSLLLAACGGGEEAAAPADATEAVSPEETPVEQAAEGAERADFKRVIFLHHSTGAALIEQGGVRERLTEIGYEFYDHGYNDDGLVLADGTWTGTNFGVPDDNTDPDGYAAIFAQPLNDPPDNTFSHLMQYDVIAFKSCFPVSNIGSDEQLADYRSYYLSIRDRMDEYPNKIFIVVTPPPEIPNDTDPEAAARAREFADWLASNEYLSGHPNVFTFNFFDLLADASDDMLRAEYRTDESDAHPNETANQAIGPLCADFIDEAVKTYAATGPASEAAPTEAPSAPAATPTSGRAAPAGTSSDLVQPGDLVYVGAFRLPEGGERPRTFAYGANAMTLNPNGDPSGLNDGFPGSLFITGHDRLPYGELPDGGQVAEVSIPEPVSSRSLSDLNRAELLQDFHDVAAGHFTQMEEIPRIGLLYLDNPATGPKIHIAYGQHFEPDPTAPTHAWFSPDLSNPDFQGEWFIGDRSFYSVNDYLLEIPTVWADAHAQGRYVGTGRFRDGGWSGMGPALFAYRPWADESGAPAPSGSHLEETTLLLYENSMNTESIERSLSGYQHPDDWAGGAWITTASGKSSLLFVGTKSNGTKYWYGWVNPAGPEQPCIETELIGQFPLCRLADGSLCPPEDLSGCAGHNDFRGWWSTHFDAEFIFYDPADLARVAAGETASWEPQPYAMLDIDEHLFLNPSGVEQEMIGTGDQRRYRIGDAAYDRQNGLLYVLELFADEASPVVHVWRVKG
jgi:hypothetical protein